MIKKILLIVLLVILSPLIILIAGLAIGFVGVITEGLFAICGDFMITVAVIASVLISGKFVYEIVKLIRNK